MTQKVFPQIAFAPRLLITLLLTAVSIPLALPEVQAADAGFFTKVVDCEGIPVRASKNVEDRALNLACGKIKNMLAMIPNVKTNLIRNGAELHIIGRSEETSDLPEFSDRRGVVYEDNTGKATTIDQRARGMGGRLSSCGEENLLALPDDRYAGMDICTHEFSHGVMDFGFDVLARSNIALQYRKSTASGLWKNSYAAVNEREFWAETSMWYFGGHGSRFYTDGTPNKDGATGLREYDPATFALLDSLYNHAGKDAVTTAPIILSTAPLPSVNRAIRIDDLKSLPLDIPAPDGRVALYQKFLAAMRPRAVAFAVEGRGGSVTSGGKLVADRAIEGCESQTGGKPCKLYAVNDDVVW